VSTWDPELGERATRQAHADALGGAERVRRQHETGRLTVRERLDALLDAGSFREVGALAGSASYADDGSLSGFTPTGIVTGRGRVDGRRVVVAADDFTVKGGAASAALMGKQVAAEQQAGELGVPLVRLLDGTGGGGTVEMLLEMGRTYVPWNPGWDSVVANLSRIPVVSVALGPVAGLGAARLVTSHVSVMVRGISQVFIAGPAVVEAGMGERVDKEALGGADVVERAGTVDLVADSEEHACALVRSVLAMLPAHAGAPVPRIVTGDPADRRDPALRDAVPRERRRPYDVRAVLRSVFDAGTVLELGRRFAPSTVTALARLDGHPVVVLASDPKVYGGGLTANGARKAERAVDLAETFGLPVVHLVDQPGFVLGTASEGAATIRAGARLLAAVQSTTVPWASVLLRRVFGVAGAGHRPLGRASFRVAWPSGDWGSLPVEGGLEVAFKRVLAEVGAERAAALREDLAQRMEAVRSPFRTAEAFGVEDVVDPAQTRPLLAEWVADAVAAPRAPRGPGARYRP
jgi:acetyl-CoA carboxylase carboxyltransferase component